MSSLAEASWWEGAIDESLSASEEAYRLYLHSDEPRPRAAAMLAMDIALALVAPADVVAGFDPDPAAVAAARRSAARHRVADRVTFEVAPPGGRWERGTTSSSGWAARVGRTDYRFPPHVPT